ncbi:MAG: flagellar filament capping protein FliD [Gemmatimonadota bacterium]
MDPIATFQGLATGINFRDLVDQIIQAESRPTQILEERVSEIDRKTTAWGDFESRVQTLFDRSQDLSDGKLFRTFSTSVTGMTGNNAAPLSASASTTAQPGSFSLQVLQLATREKVGSDVFTTRDTAVGAAGEFLIGGVSVTLSSTDTLDDIAVAVNQANTGSSPSGVAAQVVGSDATGYRLILTADDTGAEGISLADGSGGALSTLGFLDGTTSIKNQTSDGAKSDGLLSSSTAVASLLGLSSAPASSAVTIGGFSVTIDLSTDSLDDIAAAINSAATGAGSSVTAAVVSETDSDGATIKRLDISGTTSFTDANNILQTLGVLEGGRAAVAQQVQGAAFTDGDSTTVATGSTLLTDLWNGGASEGVQVGDSMSLQGTRGDGTTFTKTFTVAASSTYQDLVDALNSATDAFGAGTRTATASISASGALQVTDGTAGDSRLDLVIVANNEGGGTLDFGTFTTVNEGRDREITAGVDAQVELDGAFFSRSSNVISDLVTGVTMTLSEASSDVVTVDVARDADAIVDGITAFVKAYNAVSEFVNSQFTGSGSEEGSLKRPLSGDGTIREMRSQLRAALETAISSTVTDVKRLSELGITLNREGTFDIDEGELRTALSDNALSVERYFSLYATGSVASLEYISSTDETGSGSYEVSVTTKAAQASVTGSGFGGTYVDDGTGDTLTITDADTQSEYSVTLTNGMTLAQIVDALNTEFGTAKARKLEAANTLYSDAVGTAASESTTLQSLYDATGTNLGVADGDVITISGSRKDGTTFFEEWTVTDAATQTLGDLRAQITDAVGSEVVMSFASGVLTATAVEAGRSTVSLSVSSDNAGGGTFSFGGISATEKGRGTVGITASDSGGELKLAHDDYGSAAGFDVAFTAGGTDGSSSLGLAAGSYRGTDIAGTIGGQSATGAGRTLTGDTGTSAEGLVVRYTGSGTGSVGTLTYSRGIASLMELAADVLLDAASGTIQGVTDRLDTQKQGIEDRIAEFEDRLDRRRDQLIRKFSALEEAMAKAQQQAAWIQSQLGALVAPSTSV